QIRHVFVLVMENESGATVLQNPYFRDLAARGARLSNYHAVAHPSQPNYLAMIAGAPFVSDDGSYNLPQSNLGDLIETAGLSWAEYEEEFPGDCFTGASAGDSKTGTYARKHNPFISFNNIR